MTTTCLFSELDDRALIAVTKRLSGEETRATAALLPALIEVDARRLYLAEGCASLFVWCTQVLHLCEGGAYNRIEVARAARTYPIILALVEEGAITLTVAIRCAAADRTTTCIGRSSHALSDPARPCHAQHTTDFAARRRCCGTPAAKGASPEPSGSTSSAACWPGRQ